MTGFLGNIINEFTHQGGSEQQQQQSYGGGGYGQQQQQGAPQVYPPWRAVWEQGRWLYINDQNGERTFEHPGNYGGGASQGGYGYGGGSGYNSGAPQEPYGQREEQRSGGNHNVMYGALGAAAGLAGGALLMHEGEDIKEDWDRGEDRVERKVDEWGNDIADAPEDVARWTGEKVQEVEDIPDDVERGWDHMEQKVEDIPEDIAEDVGEGVGRVERFGDNMDNAYDQGRDEERYEDNNW
ncbi:hypothetical protein AAFC00_005305 [Neodothiora populina]|uniref:WW domain-containing protein n=1 Tax=Neodothiora populina TaxID=2781224 RepID=A0ABR3PKG2_9PEZI